MRLFCLPYAGGGASVFRSWSKGLPQNLELCAVQLPGRENRFQEPPFHQITPLVEALVIALAPQLDKPYSLYGHSVGALIAFELARKLGKKQGYGPAHLFVSAHRAPRQVNQDQPIHQLADDEFIRELQRRYDGIPCAIRENHELMELLIPVLRADFALSETYVYVAEEPLSCPITAFGGLKDTNVSADDLNFWGQETNHDFSLHMFPGAHFFLHEHLAVLLPLVGQSLMLFLARSPAQQTPTI